MKADRTLIFFLGAVLAVAFMLNLGATRWTSSSPSFSQPIVLGMSLTTIIIFLWLRNVKTRAVPGNNFELVTFYLLSIFSKFILAGVAVFVMLKEDPAGGDGNVVFFLICYVVFTAVEVVALLLSRSSQ